jgi:hypothetical protein
VSGISRRRLLCLAAAAVASASTIPFLIRSRFIDENITSLLREHFVGIHLSDEVLGAFLHDLRSEPRVSHVFQRVFQISRGEILKHRIGFMLPRSPDNPFIETMEWIVRHFVLSTNIISDDRVLAGTIDVSYVRLWHELLPCNNMFANFQLDEKQGFASNAHSPNPVSATC